MNTRTTASASNQDVVNTINKKLGTNFTVFDYAAWENGAVTESAAEFAKAVERFVGSPIYRLVTTLDLILNWLEEKLESPKWFGQSE